MAKAKRPALKQTMLPVQCWFPMSLLALHFMQLRPSKPCKKVHNKTKAKKRPCNSGACQVGHNVAVERVGPKLDLRTPKSALDYKFEEACHRDLCHFSAWSSLPRLDREVDKFLLQKGYLPSFCFFKNISLVVDMGQVICSD